MILYWCIQEPRYVGVGVAWALGLVMDVADATVFGQHALAYAALAYSAEYFRRRVLRFPLWQQAPQVAVLLLLCAALILLVRFVGGAPDSALDVLRAAAASARCCGRWCRCCCSGRSARRAARANGSGREAR